MSQLYGSRYYTRWVSDGVEITVRYFCLFTIFKVAANNQNEDVTFYILAQKDIYNTTFPTKLNTNKDIN